jgi:hypothetical protein
MYIYAVVSGTKRFYILPPAALPFVYYMPYEHMQVKPGSQTRHHAVSM